MYEKSFGMLHGVRIRVCGTGDWQSFIEAWIKFKPKKTRPTVDEEGISANVFQRGIKKV